MVIQVNYFGTKNMIKALIPLMRPSPAGARIVSVTSQLGRFSSKRHMGLRESGGWPHVQTDYSLSKLAVNTYARLMARIFEERPEGHKIYINCYCPEEAADTAVWLALLPDQFVSGKFFAERRQINF
ncbi:unnamed protein product [Withania somnifera]